MKKFILYTIGLILVVLTVMVYRAETYFKDTQFHPTKTLERVQLDEKAVLARFSKSIQIPTISYDNLADFDYAPFLQFHEFLETDYPNVTANSTSEIINGYSLLYKFEGSNKDLKPALFMGHMDVVPVDDITLDQWTHPPFAGTVADGNIWGRGSMDDKSTVMALMEAMELLQSENQTFERTIYFAFGHDEEVGGPNGAKKIAEHLRSQGVELEFVLDEGGAIVDGMVPGIRQPMAVIGIAEKGFINIRLEVDQPGGHSSSPPDTTALGILAKAIVNVENNKFPTTLEYSNIMVNGFGYYADFTTRLVMANQWLLGPVIKSQMLNSHQSAASLRTTTAATMATGSSKSNILPTRATAVINFRILPGETTDTVIEHVRKAINDDRVTLHAFMENNPSAVSSTDSLGFKLIAETIREFDNDTLVTPYMVGGGTDSKHFYGLSDSIYRFMMAKLDPKGMTYIHGIDERLSTDNFIMAVQYFHEVIKKAGTTQ